MKLLILTLLLQFAFAFTAKCEELSIIVNEQNPVNEISEEQIISFFLKKSRQWPNGTPVRFFDRRDDSEQRKIFLNTVVKKTSREIELYWIGQKLYTGNSAPLQVASDSMSAAMVSRFPGAIGYVSSAFAGAPGVKKVALKRE